ncbi:MAG: TRAP transporter small permease [Bacteroidetes bacterium]|jgi:TRAP-type C4-dicarboxylate transport system permease small subunit|nr:TRAP transporter small permease [Bacteroidota bacterium]
MKILLKIDRAFASVEGALLILLLSVMILLAFVQVVLRNAFHEGFIWADILLRHLVLWIGILGAALAASQQRHITVDALTRFLPPRLRLGVLAFAQLFAVAVCVVLADAAVTFVRNDLAFGSTVYGEVPAWTSQIIIPVGFALLAFHFLVRALENAVAAYRGGER